MGGRKKGTPNKIGAEAKTVIAQAAEGLGGVSRLIEWAKELPENERAFWSNIYPKLVPHQITGDKDNPLKQIVEISFRSGV